MLHYALLLDEADDGTYQHDEALNQAVLSLKWRIGQQDAYQALAPPARADILLYDPQGRYSADGDLRLLGRRIRIACALDASELFDDASALFTGYITALQPAVGDWQTPTCTLIAHDLSASFAHIPALLPLLEGVRADEVLAQLLDFARLRPPKTQGRWLLGRAEHSELAQHTRCAVLAYQALQTGRSRWAQVGALKVGDTLADVIQRLMDAERGRFCVDERGVLRFFNRHHLLKQQDARASLSDSAHDLRYTWGAGQVGRVRIELEQVLAANEESVVWRASQALRLEARSVYRHAIQFQDAYGRPSSASALQTPLPAQDYQALTLTGRSQPYAVACRLSQVHSFGAVLEWRNDADETLVVQAGAQLRARVLSAGAAVLVERVALFASAQGLPETLHIRLAFSESAETADAIARYELARRGQKRGMVQHLALDARQHPHTVQSARLYERLDLHFQRPVHHASYHIVGAQHEVTQGGAQHLVTYVLEPADAVRFWCLGAERLGQHSRLAY